MGKQFEIGEIAIAVQPPDRSDKWMMSGEYVEVIKPLRVRRLDDGSRAACYIVLHCGQTYFARPNWLRKKPQRREEASWERCLWQPEKVQV